MNKNIQIFLFTLVLASLCLPENYNSMSLIALGLFTLISQYKNFSLVGISKYYSILLVPLVASLGILWTNDVEFGVKSMHLFALFFIIPIIFSFYQLDSNFFLKVNLYFTFILLIVILLHFGRSFYLILNEGHFYFIKDSHKYYFLQYTRLSPYIDPTYFSLIISYNLFFIMNRLFNSSKNGLYLYTAIFLIELIFFILLFARGVQIAFLIGTILYLVWLKRIRWYYYVLFTIFLVFAMVIFKDSPFLNRYNRFQNIDKYNYESLSKRFTSESYRLIIAEYVITHWQDYLPIGNGTGSQKNSMSSMNLKSNNGNTHNQYIDFYIQWGLLGSTIFILYFGTLKNVNIKKEDWCFIFMITIILTSLTENILNRQKGIVLTIYLCSFIINLKISKNTIKEDSN